MWHRHGAPRHNSCCPVDSRGALRLSIGPELGHCVPRRQGSLRLDSRCPIATAELRPPPTCLSMARALVDSGLCLAHCGTTADAAVAVVVPRISPTGPSIASALEALPTGPCPLRHAAAPWAEATPLLSPLRYRPRPSWAKRTSCSVCTACCVMAATAAWPPPVF